VLRKTPGLKREERENYITRNFTVLIFTKHNNKTKEQMNDKTRWACSMHKDEKCIQDLNRET
jgi:hypothetical protein